MATNIQQFYNDYVKPLSREEQIRLIAVTADEISRTDSGQASGNVSGTAPDSAPSLTEAAWRLYDAKLKPILEPQHCGQVVAVDLDTEDYEVAKRSASAWRALKVRRPKARVVVIDIGSVKLNDSLELRNKGVLSDRSSEV
jgi:hypothetical protein